MDISAPYQDLSTVSLYADFKEINHLKSAAKEDKQKALHEVAKQFEAIMIQTLLKSVRESNRAFSNDLFGSSQTEFYEDLFDQQMSLALSGKGFGLAKMLEDELLRGPPGQQETRMLDKDLQTNDLKEMITSHLPDDNVAYIKEIEKKTTEKTLSAESTTEKLLFKFKSPSEFVTELWDYAKKAGESINIDPKVLLAQAALETGWGNYIAKHQDGKSSFNLFGIKADPAWEKEKVSVNTVEYKKGVVVKEKALFRSYPSFLESFMDYANLLKGDRFQGTLKNSQDHEGFLHKLQQSGYATDPNYAKKIIAILKSDVFNDL